MERAATPVQTAITEDTEERLIALITQNSSLRHALYKTLEFCNETPQSSAEVDEAVASLIPGTSVYNATVLRDWLERAGGLERPGTEGSQEKDAQTPDFLLEKDGSALPEEQNTSDSAGSVSGLQDVDIPLDEGAAEKSAIPSLWQTTPAGARVLDVLAPSKLLRALIEGKDAHYIHIYSMLLSFCGETPRSKNEIEDLIGDHPDLQNPRRYASYFINRLGEVGAIEWNGKWSTTEIGSTAIQR